MNPTVCPKCGYERRPGDTAPDWQCPSCGIAYRKFRDATAGRAEEPAPDLRERTVLSEGQADQSGGTAFFVYGLLLFAFAGLAIYVPGSRVASWLPAVFAACAFCFWLGAYRRLRMVADVPTSMVAAAAQGYVELIGTAASAPGNTLVGYLTRIPCIWYRFNWYRPGKDDERDSGERGVPFILRDATGECLVELDGAEVICDRCQTWSRDGTVYQEWSIRVGDPVYAIGHFTSGGAAEERQVDMRAAYAVAAQQREGNGYVTRFDANVDGKVDRLEAARAHEAQRREILRQQVQRGGVHTMTASPDGRPFLVMGASQDKGVVSRYRLLAAAHLGVFVFALAVAGFFWNSN